jgi:hypothetical protein
MAKFPGAVMLASLLVYAYAPLFAGEVLVEDTSQHIDELLQGELAAGPSQSLSACSDEVFLRRVSLDLAGQLPTPQKVLAFVEDKSPDKRARLIDELLASEDFGRNWARYWRDVIMMRRSDERALIARQPLETHLVNVLNENTPWNEVASGFITALGDVRENGSTGLIMAQMGRPEDTVAEVSRIFMGIQIQCAQCHDHPTDRWKREQFHELAAFFPRVAVRPTGMDGPRSFAVVADDAPQFRRRVNNDNRFRGTPEHYMPDLEDPQARGTKMQPVLFATGAKLDLGTKDAERRATLAQWVTAKENPWFAKAMVNRLWSELVGEGFYEPVDDIGPDRTCNSPKTLEHLSTAFAESGYDVKRLYRTILLTDAYQRESQPRRSHGQPAFAANCPQRLRGDQLFDALVRAIGLSDRGGGFRGRGGAGYAAFGSPRGQFSQLFGYDPSDPREEVEGSIPQALAMMNSSQINSLMKVDSSTQLGRLVRQEQSNVEVVTQLYLRTLARQPSEMELRKCLEYVEEVGDREEAFEDVQWSLVNSAEFLHRR